MTGAGLTRGALPAWTAVLPPSGVGGCERSRRQFDLRGFVALLLPITAIFNAFPMTEINGYLIKASDVLTVVTALPALSNLALSASPAVRAPAALKWVLWYGTALVMYLSVLAAAPLLYSQDVINWKYVGRFCGVLLWGMLALCLIRGGMSLFRVIWAVAIAGAVMGVASANEFLHNLGLNRLAGFYGGAGGDGLKSQASFNEVGAFHGLCLGLLCVLWSLGSGRARHGLLLVLLGLNIVGLLLTGSRSGYAAAAVTLAVVLFYLARLRIASRRWLRSLMLVIVLASACYVASSALVDVGFSVRLEETVQPYTVAHRSMTERFLIWQRCFDFIRHHPQCWPLGIGIANIQNQLDYTSAESFFLDHLMGEGVVGLTVLLLLLFRPWKTLRRKAATNPIYLCGIAAIANAAVVSLTGNVLVDPMFGSTTFLVIYGCVAAAHTGNVRRRR